MQLLASQIAAHRPMLLRVARRKLRNEAWAEDAVSETFVAALARPDRYAGLALLPTWLVGILRHKVVDQIRLNTRERQIEDFADEPDHGDAPAALRQGAGDAQAAWGDPQQALCRRQFIAQFDTCLKALPAPQARAVVMRDVMEEDIDDICKQLGVTANNLSVMLHRARRQLRASLQACGAVALPGPHLHAHARARLTVQRAS